MNLKYYIGALFSLPLLPLMYIQGRIIRVKIPKLPEATGIKGFCPINGQAEKTIQILTLGESTIAGVGVKTHKEGFTGALATELSKLLTVNVNWKVYAQSGYTASDVTKLIVPTIHENKVDLIVIGLGANDAFSLHRPSKWIKDCQVLIERLQVRFPKTPIVFCNMPPVKEFPAFTSLIKLTIGNLIVLLGQELGKLVKQYDGVYYYGDIITFEDWMEKLQIDAKKSDFFSDGVHPSKLTYQAWGKDIAVRVANENKIVGMLQEKYLALKPR